MDAYFIRGVTVAIIAVLALTFITFALVASTGFFFSVS